MLTPVHALLRSSVQEAMLEDSWDTLPANPLRRFLVGVIRDALREDSWDIRRWRQRLAVIETCQFIEAELPLVTAFSSYHELFRFAAEVSRESSAELVCEFGVWQGRTITALARLFPERTIYGFDAFQGLPEPWRDGYPRGIFHLPRLPRVPPNVRLVRGWFHETLPTFLHNTPGQVAFLHIDCDLYSSAKTVLDALRGRLAQGSVILFDEFFNYPGWRAGEYRAWTELVADGGLGFEYLGYTRASRQMAVRITRAP
jgi:methyltransferase family protein